MNKKGSHVDWVISMGIFITYIFALFILLRPGVTPVYRPVNLLDNLQEQFENDTMWTIKSVPLFIRKCITTEIEHSTVTVVDLNDKWSLGGVRDENGEEKSKSLECSDSDNFVFKKDGKSIPFYFYFHKTGDGNAEFEVRFSCRTKTPETDCIAELGVVEDINGINKIKLNLDYDTVKEDWGVPLDKNFAIFIDEDVDGSNEHEIKKIEPYEQANVFVRRIESQFVEKDGDTTPVAVYLQIW